MTITLDKHQRYRLKDLDAYRKRKREYAKTAQQRTIRRNYMRVWREKNRSHHNDLCRASYHRHKHKHIERNKNNRLLNVYGIPLSEYKAMYDIQQGLCAICKLNPRPDRALHIDHDHATGAVRQLLCSRCNGALGWFEKYKESILGYVERHTRT